LYTAGDTWLPIIYDLQLFVISGDICCTTACIRYLEVQFQFLYSSCSTGVVICCQNDDFVYFLFSWYIGHACCGFDCILYCSN